MFQKIQHFLFKSIDSTIVNFFRIGFGIFMIYQITYYFQIDYTYQFMTGPQVLFPFDGFEFVKPLSSGTLRTMHFGMLVAAILITVGLLYRVAIIYFFLVFSYFFLIDKTLYNNHIYLICLISFAMIFVQADNRYSLRSKFSKKNLPKAIPAWNQYLLAFLIALPYFFGGIAKLSDNWLATALPSIIVEQSRHTGFFGLLSKEATIFFIKYAGIVFDLLIVFILLFRKTRWIGLLLVIIFNLSNHSVLFNDIGLFPFLMIFSTILFFNSERLYTTISSFFKKKEITTKKSKKIIPKEVGKNQPKEITWALKNKLIFGGLILFFVFHMIYPLRHLVLTYNPEWTGIGSYFSWRMKMQQKDVTTFTMRFTDRSTNDYGPVEAETFLTKNQLIHIAEDPKNYIHFAKYLQKRIERETGLINPKLTATVEVKFNGLPKQYLFDPKLDLVEINKQVIKTGTWINVLKK